MTPEELRDCLERADIVASEMGLGLCDGLSLVWATKRPPNGYKIRTPLGNCQIMNCQEKNGEYETVFRATRKQIFSYLKKHKLITMTREKL